MSKNELRKARAQLEQIHKAVACLSVEIIKFRGMFEPEGVNLQGFVDDLYDAVEEIEVEMIEENL